MSSRQIHCRQHLDFLVAQVALHSIVVHLPFVGARLVSSQRQLSKHLHSASFVAGLWLRTAAGLHRLHLAIHVVVLVLQDGADPAASNLVDFIVELIFFNLQFTLQCSWPHVLWSLLPAWP